MAWGVVMQARLETRRIGTLLERERARIAILGATILGIHAVGLALLVGFAPTHPGLVGAAALAYTLGLRHAFDADHIAAIEALGYGMAGMFLATWVLSMALWRVLDIEKSWATGQRTSAVIEWRR